MFYGLKGGSFTPVIVYKNSRNKMLSGISQDYKNLLRPKNVNFGNFVPYESKIIQNAVWTSLD